MERVIIAITVADDYQSTDSLNVIEEDVNIHRETRFHDMSASASIQPLVFVECLGWTHVMNSTPLKTQEGS